MVFLFFIFGLLATTNYIVDKRVRAIDDQWRILAICIQKTFWKKKIIKAGVGNEFPGRVRNCIRSALGCIPFQVDPGYQLKDSAAQRDSKVLCSCCDLSSQPITPTSHDQQDYLDRTYSCACVSSLLTLDRGLCSLTVFLWQCLGRQRRNQNTSNTFCDSHVF